MGTPTWATYAAATWAGVNPMLLSTPIRRYPATTAPLTTLATMSTDRTRAMMANATTNGVLMPCSEPVWSVELSQDTYPDTAPAGRTAFSAETSAVICGPDPALVKSYSIPSEGAAPALRKAVISLGTTQASSSRTTDPA